MAKKKNLIKEKSPIFVITAIALSFAVILYIILFYWGFITSLKKQNEFRVNNFGLPQYWAWENFSKVLSQFFVPVYVPGGIKKVGILEMAYNTIVYSLGGAFSVVTVQFMVAYVTSKYDSFFNKILVNGIILISLLPTVGGGAATMKLMHNLGLLDNRYYILVTNLSMISYQTLFFRGFFSGISKEYMDAARIDGAGELTIFTRVMLPMSYKVYTTYIFLTFMGLYNDYMGPLLYMKSYPVLAYAVFSLSTRQQEGFTTVPIRLASAFLLAIPISLLFIAIQKKIIIVVDAGGLKE